MRLCALILSVVVAVAVPTLALAEEVPAGTAVLSIAPPPGACAYDRSNEHDAVAIERVESSQAGLNDVVLQFGQCDEFERWRTGGVIFSQFGQIMLPLNYPGAPMPIPVSRQKYLDLIALQIPKLSDTQTREIQSLLNDKIDDAQITGSQLLGILDRDENALYVGFLGVLEIGDHRFPLVGIGAFTLLKSVPATVNLYRPVGEGAFDKLIDLQKAYVAELVRQNP